MSEELRSRIYNLYAAYGKGGLEFALNFFDDDAEFISYAPVGVFPFLGRRHGKAAIAEMMQKCHAEFEYVTYQPIFLVVESDNVGLIVMARLRQRSTDRMIHLLAAHFIRFRDGLIIELREFIDSFDAVEQVLGRELNTAKL